MTSHDRTLGRDLDAIVRKALARSPDERYQSVDELAEDVARYRDGRPVAAARAPGPWRSAASFVRRHRVAFGAAAMALLAVVGFGAVSDMRGRRLEEQRLALEDHRAAAVLASTELGRTLDRFDRLTSLSAVRRAVQLGGELQRQAATPELVPPMRRWLEQRARPLVAQIAALDAALVDVNGRSPEWTEDVARKYAERRQRLRETVEEHARLVADAGAFGQGLWRAWDACRRITTQRDQLASEFAMPLQSEEDQYVRDVLAELLSELEALRAVTLPAIESHLGWAEAVRRKTIEDHADDWRRAAEAIRRHPRYGGLELAPQLGLIPLGENPRSGLWEFWHPRSAADGAEPPTVQPDGSVAVTEDSGIVFVLIPSGVDVETGLPVEPFLLAKHELTQAQYQRLAGRPSSSHYTSETFPQLVKDRTHPVEAISWLQARRLLRGYGLRLPDSLEWETACRAGTTGTRYTGDSPDSLRGHANIAGPETARATSLPAADWEDGYVVTAPVGSFLPSPYGLYDMFGNVAEICDLYRLPYKMSGHAEDSTVCEDRGGDWSSHPSVCHAEYALMSRADWAKPFAGIRPARSLSF